MSLFLKKRRVLLVLGFLSLIVVLGHKQSRSNPDHTTPAEAHSELSSVTYYPIIKISGPYPAETVNVEPFIIGLQTETINDIRHAGDNRLFIVEREGRIRIAMPDGAVLPTPFLDISGPTVATENWEQGLLGLAFHPNYANNGFFFIFYTHAPSDNIRLMRYKVSADPNVADPLSGVILLDIPKPVEPGGEVSKVHNGGSLQFGPDGYLYVSIGDGGPDPWIGSNTPGDPYNNGQRLNRLFGKILRIDVNGNNPDCGLDAYGIPPTNPYVGSLGNQCDEIWANGLRNPWRISFDRLSGDLFIGDVGEWQFEELNYQPAGSPGGQNYGWHCYEGSSYYVLLYPQIIDDCPHPQSFYTFPIFEYPRTPPCTSIVAGYMYRGYEFPEIYGQYLFADFCTGRIWRTAQTDGVWETALVADIASGGISTFGEGYNGELYLGTYLSGIVYKIVE